jgi:hypothetical protein
MYDDELAGYGAEIVGDDMDALVGDDDLSDDIDDLLDMLEGDDDADWSEVGARRRRRRIPAGVRRKYLRKLRARSLRRYPLGLGTTALAANASAIITVNPQLPYKLERLLTPSVSGTVDNIQVGIVSQFVNAGAIPWEVFAPTTIGTALKGDTAIPGVAIQITVTDTLGAANTFAGALMGLVAQ